MTIKIQTDGYFAEIEDSSLYLLLKPIFGNSTRDIIVSEAIRKGKVTWQYLDDVKINPNMIRLHLRRLRNFGIIKKSKPHGYEVTPNGSKLYDFFKRYELSQGKKIP